MDRKLLCSFLGSVSAFALSLGSANAAGLPSGGQYVSGQGTIHKSNQSVTVKQSSTTGIIDWNKFSIGSKNSVTFYNGSGATLSRVTGGNLTAIAGTLHATGSLYLLNNAGVIVSGTGHVVTGGSFVVSSGSLTDGAFDAGDHKLFHARAAVINRGSIVSGGETKLVGGSVVNTGTIHAAEAKLYARGGDALDTGAIFASGNARRDARILMIAANGKTRVTGQLTARNTDGSGGHIETSGDHVSIAGSINAGDNGTWLVDPKNLTVGTKAAATIDKALGAGTNVTLKTTKSGTSGAGSTSNGPGDIEIAAALSWSGAATLTLDAYHSVVVDKAISLSGKGGVIVDTQNGGLLSFTGGNIDFAKLAGSLTINGAKYQLVNSIAGLASAIASDPSGDFALAQSYSATKDGTYSSSPIAASFTGTFEGLGNSISHFTISSANADVGLFSDIGSGGTVSDLALTGASVTSSYSGQDGAVGVLTATNEGSIRGVTVGGTVNATGTDDGGSAQDELSVGGIAGANDFDITNSSSSATVTANAAAGANVGGLVGYDGSGSIITGSSASGAISGTGQESQVGGLIGTDNGSVTASSASGNVTGGDQGNYGGLVADETGLISESFATGKVTCGDDGALIGGLVGENDGTIETSYATGAVLAGNADPSWGLGVGGLVGYNDGTISTSYATGATTGGNATGSGQMWIGGLVGINIVAGTGTGVISDSYATGNVSGGTDTDDGGFVGVNNTSASIDQAYSTGKVKGGTGSVIGGFAGVDGGAITSAYWDTTTSNIKTASQGAGNPGNDPGIKGKTTAQLRAALPAGFTSTVWAIDPDINGGLPYLKALKSSY